VKTEAFIEQALASDTDECVFWPYAKRNGYGAIGRKGQGTLYVCMLSSEGIGSASYI
jgi:hypothetical protein